jgi:hypothetical protein
VPLKIATKLPHDPFLLAAKRLEQIERCPHFRHVDRAEFSLERCVFEDCQRFENAHLNRVLASAERSLRLSLFGSRVCLQNWIVG